MKHSSVAQVLSMVSTAVTGFAAASQARQREVGLHQPFKAIMEAPGGALRPLKILGRLLLSSKGSYVAFMLVWISADQGGRHFAVLLAHHEDGGAGL